MTIWPDCWRSFWAVRSKGDAMKMGYVILAAALFTGCGSVTGKDGAGFKVALVTPGSVADAAWNAGAYQGLQEIRDSLGARVSNVEAHTPAEQEEALRSYA